MNIGLIGFGEVGGILATDLKARGADVAAWDLLMAQPAMREKARAAGISTIEIVDDPRIARARARAAAAGIGKWVWIVSTSWRLTE